MTRTAVGHAPSGPLDTRRLPRHIAVIMDGNGRWAQARGQSRLLGHAAGAERAKELTERCGTLGI